MSEGQVLCLFAVPSQLKTSRICLRSKDEHCHEHRYTYKKTLFVLSDGCEKQHHPFQRESVFNMLPYDTGVFK